MKSALFLFLVCTPLLGFSSAPVGVVLTKPSSAPPIVTINLFQEVSTELAKHNITTLTGDSWKSKFKTELPYISQRSFRKHMKTLATDKTKPIYFLQRISEELLLSSIYIVDCSLTKSLRARSCSISKYSREDAKVVVHANKDFSVPLNDASKWASVLVSAIEVQSKAHKRKKERKELNKLMKAEDKEATTFKVISLSLTPIKPFDESEESVLVTGLGLGLETDQKYFSAHYAQDSDNSNTMINSTRRISLIAGGYSRALDSISWNLDFGVHATRFQGKTDVEDISIDVISAHIAPGLYWHLGDSFRFGVDYRFSLPLEVKSDLDLSYNEFEGASLSFQTKL